MLAGLQRLFSSGTMVPKEIVPSSPAPRIPLIRLITIKSRICDLLETLPRGDHLSKSQIRSKIWDVAEGYEPEFQKALVELVKDGLITDYRGVYSTYWDPEDEVVQGNPKLTKQQDLVLRLFKMISAVTSPYGQVWFAEEACAKFFSESVSPRRTKTRLAELANLCYLEVNDPSQPNKQYKLRRSDADCPGG